MPSFSLYLSSIFINTNAKEAMQDYIWWFMYQLELKIWRSLSKRHLRRSKTFSRHTYVTKNIDLSWISLYRFVVLLTRTPLVFFPWTVSRDKAVIVIDRKNAMVLPNLLISLLSPSWSLVRVLVSCPREDLP